MSNFLSLLSLSLNSFFTFFVLISIYFSSQANCSQPPIISNIDPNFSVVGREIDVKIRGKNFLPNETKVFFGNFSGLHIQVLSDNLISVTVPKGSGQLPVRLETPFGKTTYHQQFSYFLPPSPPSNFIGFVKKNNKKFFVKFVWDRSPDKQVAVYRIYSQGKVLKELYFHCDSGPCLEYTKVFSSIKKLNDYTIVSVSSIDIESDPVKIKLKHEK